jgi:RNase P/RNase MRP subunit POP5
MWTSVVKEGFLVVHVTVEEKVVAAENVYLIRQIIFEGLRRMYGEAAHDIPFDIVSHSPEATVVRFPRGDARLAWTAFTCITSHNSLPCQVRVLKFAHFLHSAYSDSRSFDF